MLLLLQVEKVVAVNECKTWEENRNVLSQPVVLKVMCRSTIVASQPLRVCTFFFSYCSTRGCFKRKARSIACQRRGRRTLLSLRSPGKTLSLSDGTAVAAALVKHKLFWIIIDRNGHLSPVFCGSHINTHTLAQAAINNGKMKISNSKRTVFSFCSTRQVKRINQTLSTN